MHFLPICKRKAGLRMIEASSLAGDVESCPAPQYPSTKLGGSSCAHKVSATACALLVKREFKKSSLLEAEIIKSLGKIEYGS